MSDRHSLSVMCSNSNAKTGKNGAAKVNDLTLTEKFDPCTLRLQSSCFLTAALSQLRLTSLENRIWKAVLATPDTWGFRQEWSPTTVTL